MATCFVSYASIDRVLAEGLAVSLRTCRYKVWLDVNELRGGDTWETEIKQALATAQICLVALTPDSVQSDWVKQEIALARQTNKQVIPLLMRTIQVPQALEVLGIADLQFIDFVRYGYIHGLNKLMDELPPIDPVNPVSGFKALVIEDMPPQQLAIQRVLESMDIAVITAGDFDAALEQIRGEQFDLVTLDMQLDDLDTAGQRGYLLLEELHAFQRGVPVIIISVLEWSGTAVRDFLREYDVYDYLPKPFRPENLRTIAQAALAGHEPGATP